VLGAVYTDLIRNAVLMKDKKTAELLRTDGARRFTSPETQAPEEWWTALSGWMDAWTEKIHPAEEKKLVRLREEHKAAPEDPARVWALAVSLAEGVHAQVEARGYLAWLLENHPEFAQVQNGNCLHRRAELLWSAREIPQAIRRYHDLQGQHKEHPKVLESGPTGVQHRLDEAYKLRTRMGFKAK
jgi:hypothetical protein